METKIWYEYTIGDIFELLSSGRILAETLEAYFPDIVIDGNTHMEFNANSDVYIKKLFDEYIYLDQAKSVVVISESEENNSTNADIVDFLRRLVRWLNQSYTYYKTLIDIYTDKLSTLMGQVQSIDTDKMGSSDMPQTATFADFTGAETSADNLSGLQQSKHTNSADYGTPMQRIDEIKRNLENCYSRWYEEFVRKFIIE